MAAKSQENCLKKMGENILIAADAITSFCITLKPDYLINFYKNYPTSNLDWHNNESDFYSKIYNHGLDLIQSYKSSGNILDIGCSSGYFLTLASKRGYKSFGIEPNKRESLCNSKWNKCNWLDHR